MVDLETNRDQQQQLIDLQIKFIKTTAEKEGWRLNQLSEAMGRKGPLRETEHAELQADIDMLGRLRGSVPRLEQLDNPVFAAKLPTVPEGFSYTEMTECSKVDDDHSVRPYNFHLFCEDH